MVQNDAQGSPEGITELNPKLKPQQPPRRVPTAAEVAEAFGAAPADHAEADS